MELKENTPRHRQISDWIRSKIEEGEFEIDEKIPSENTFCRKFGVSRITVRKALQTLENEQLIYRRQGLGSFVKDNRSHQTLGRLTDFMEDMSRAGMEASSEVIQFKTSPVPDRIAGILKIDEGSMVIRLDRLRLGDGQPMAFDITWLPMFYGQLIDGYDLTDETIYGILEREFDIPVEKGYYRIEAENASPYIAEKLNTREGRALLLLNRLSYTVGEKPIYYQQRYYRTDRIVYELSLEREPGSEQSGGYLPLRDFTPVFY